MQLTTQINQDLLQQAMQLTGLNTEILENALRLLIKQTPKLAKKMAYALFSYSDTQKKGASAKFVNTPFFNQ